MSKKMILLAAVAGMMVVNQTRADILLNVDITDMSAVIITATGALSAVDDSTSTVYEGITLENLFSSDFSISEFLNASYGDLSGGSSGVPYEFAINSGFVPLTDLNIFNDSSAVGVAQNFSTAAQAFTGSITFNFSGASITPGSSGNIIVGDGSSSSAVLGTWQAIPEPAAASLIMIAGGTGLVIRRRFIK